MDFHVFFRPQPWRAELRGGGEGSHSGTDPLAAAAKPWREQAADTLPPRAMLSALGLLLDWLAGARPGHAVIKFFGHGPVLLLARALVFNMDAWSIMSCTAQGRFKDFLGQWARTRCRGEAPRAGGRWQP